MSTPTFIVGAGPGQCITPMLPNVLREHPKVLSLSEFFLYATDGMRTPRAVSDAFSAEVIDGQRFWSITAAVNPHFGFALRHGVEIPELLYPRDTLNARCSSLGGLPAILITALPHLTSHHDVLFDLLAIEICTWPRAPIATHYLHLFDWLATHFDKKGWIESSGGSLLMAETFLTMFPDAKFVHVVRDGRDLAQCMHQHMGFRLGFAMISLQRYLGVNPLASLDRTRIDQVPAELQCFLPECFCVDALSSMQIPLSVCAKGWVMQIESGMKLLRTLSPDRVLTLRYEDFYTDPKRQLDTLAAFLGEDYVDEGWSARCATTVRPPRSTWRDLPEEEAHTLTEACRPGFELLREAGVEYEV